MFTVKAAPFDYSFPPDKVALIVIDMQRDFVEPGGFGETLGNDVSLLTPVIPVVADLIALFRKNNWPVIHTRENHAPDLSDCPPAKRDRGNPALRIGDDGPMGRILIRGEPGADIIDALKPLPGEYVVDKPGKGAFYATDLSSILKDLDVTHLVFAGVTTEVCVQTTMREANDRGFTNLLIADATGSYFPAFKEATIAMIAAQGAIVGWVAPLSALAEAVSGGKSDG
ncbi:cysteine hydrolase family protein [Oryzibacter oryziterrae]|uniref:cysteine hydrolase family protein n=1 Tax=Oryzibacter oryziterrae TaxID=2766474 RepID=UPI001F3E4322|nr:isochorismatase family cysteine hydrolase [Oryzibacter oryziterrae]